MIKGHARDDDPPWDPWGARSQRDTTIQLLISLVLGLSAFLSFCVLRPRWAGLFAARKKQKDTAIVLPELPSTLFGWILPLWRITDQQILASAGLDAYVFLAFFKLARNFLLFTFPLSLIVIKPVHDAYPEDSDDNKTTDGLLSQTWGARQPPPDFFQYGHNGTGHDPSLPYEWETDYLWMYVIFAYLFTAFAIYLIVTETRKIIDIRQEFLGTQSTITDRTIRLSGIPAHLQDEGNIKDVIESLNIGKVESVVLCRNWKELDRAMVERMDTLRRLEEAYTVYMGYRTVERNRETLPISQPPPPGPTVDSLVGEEDESAGLMGTQAGSRVRPYARVRPKARLRYGFLKLRSKQVDAIDFYDEQLRRADERIKELRQKDFPTTPLAFVTMDSVAACQMAIQAVLDPSPLQLIASQSPAPSDVIWPNTYMSRRNRMIRAWSITAIIGLLTVFFIVLLIPIVGLLNLETIEKVLPQLAAALKEHDNIKSLVRTQLPVLIVTLMSTLVPYLNYWLSWNQGQLSQGDIELSTISKNFFFTFFNFFLVFTLLGTASNFYNFFERFGDTLRDFPNIANTLAISLQRNLKFYVNFIILQGLGLFPLRLLEIGSISLYPIYLIGAKTPRDYAELVQPPQFIYGYYLPSAILVFIICTVYSVLRSSWQVLLAGLVYFILGHFVYKYQLLYAMDHRQQSTGRAWVMICDRIFIGLFFFQLTTAGQLLLKQAFTRSFMMIPLLIATVWIGLVFGRTYKPLMQFIALSSVKRGEQFSDAAPADAASLASSTDFSLERNVWAETDSTRARRRQGARDVHRAVEAAGRFVNPSLVSPLDRLWILDQNADGSTRTDEAVGEQEEEESV